MSTVLAPRRSDSIAVLALVSMTAIWGSTFVVVKEAIARMPPADFLAVRFLLATMLMLLVRPGSVQALGRRGLKHGVLLGLALGSGYVAQTYGLQTTAVTVSGFVTGMFVVFTPLISAVLLRRQVPRVAWAGVALATTGLALLALHGFSVGTGEALTLLGAFAFGFHIVGLGEWSAQHDAYGLAVVQLGTVSVLCLAIASPGGVAMPPDLGVWAAVIGTAVFATALAFVVQTWAQAHLSPTRAAVILTMEPVFAMGFALVLGERPTPRTLVGAALVAAAMYLVELGPRHGAEGRLPHLEV